MTICLIGMIPKVIYLIYFFLFLVTQNTTYLHVLNATIDELDISQSLFRRLSSMAFTDGAIGNIVGKNVLTFPL